MNPIPKEWLTPCKMRRVVLHWTEGWRQSNAVDREHYHVLVQEPLKRPGQAELVRGDEAISDNVSTSDGNGYAAHTRGLNTGSIGVSLCGMVGCNERPKNAGRAPYTKAQYKLMCEAVAQLCKFYGIPVTERTVLGHGEVQAVLGVRQNGKWDPMMFPWEMDMAPKDVMNRMREDIKLELKALA